MVETDKTKSFPVHIEYEADDGLCFDKCFHCREVKLTINVRM